MSRSTYEERSFPNIFQIWLLISSSSCLDPPGAGRRFAGGGETLREGERRFFGIERFAAAVEEVLGIVGVREPLATGLVLAALDTGGFEALPAFADTAIPDLEAAALFGKDFEGPEETGRGDAEPLPATAGVLARDVEVDVAGTGGFFGGSFFAFPNQSLNSLADSPSSTLPCRILARSVRISSMVLVSRLFVFSLISIAGSDLRRSRVDCVLAGELCDEPAEFVVTLSTAPPGSRLPGFLYAPPPAARLPEPLPIPSSLSSARCRFSSRVRTFDAPGSSSSEPDECLLLPAPAPETGYPCLSLAFFGRP
ncbi:hypothetical protein GSI_02523 [Ganoderma sinense ZZ0214-1]|uniref:Uncharacterized protein n=1 Tax=Ganoderma sinense ZZ0214-1 TaxID=1077348 RepID=A0A2G8SQ02_9APHY|nr:hypothetical protein GSI_02523 [Ganoderma sinense ZZ0214-1]